MEKYNLPENPKVLIFDIDATLYTCPEYAHEQIDSQVRYFAKLNNMSADSVSRSVERFASAVAKAQAIVIPGGFSGGDEPDGSGKFITAFFRNEAVKEGVTELLEKRDGLMCGICNGFQALIKLGLVPSGKITRIRPARMVFTQARIASMSV